MIINIHYDCPPKCYLIKPSAKHISYQALLSQQDHKHLLICLNTMVPLVLFVTSQYPHPNYQLSHVWAKSGIASALAECILSAMPNDTNPITVA